MTKKLPPSKSDAAAGLKVLTLNTHKGFNALNSKLKIHELRDAIRSTSADIVFLQEVVGLNHKHADKHLDWPKTEHAEFLAKEVWSAFAYSKNKTYDHGHHGNAILSKYPIVEHRNHDLSLNEIEKRGLLHCEIKWPSAKTHLHLLCVHLSLLGSHRKRQCELILEYIEKQIPADHSLILAGDFNDWSQLSVKALEKRGQLTDVFKAIHAGKAARTFPAFLPVAPLDRIYCRNLLPEQAKIHRGRPWSEVSDHLAISADLRIFHKS